MLDRVAERPLRVARIGPVDQRIDLRGRPIDYSFVLEFKRTQWLRLALEQAEHIAFPLGALREKIIEFLSNRQAPVKTPG